MCALTDWVLFGLTSILCAIVACIVIATLMDSVPFGDDKE